MDCANQGQPDAEHPASQGPQRLPGGMPSHSLAEAFAIQRLVYVTLQQSGDLTLGHRPDNGRTACRNYAVGGSTRLHDGES
jgi:hypothetical protein